MAHDFEKSLYLLIPFMNRFPVLLVFVTLLFCLSQQCHAQDDRLWDGFGMEMNGFTGKVIKHTPKFHLPIPDLTKGVDLNFQWKTFGRKEWQQRRRFPIVGIGFTYGRCFSVYPNLTIPLITGKHLEWTMRIGDGIGYVTRDYSRLHPFDTMNNAIGSKINDYGSFLMDMRYHINQHWDVQGGHQFLSYQRCVLSSAQPGY